MKPEVKAVARAMCVFNEVDPDGCVGETAVPNWLAYSKFAQTVIAALDAARGESAGWRDIASAPRDGTEVLLWGRCERDGAFYGYDCNVGWYADAEMSPTGDAGWMARDLPIEPTHWQPLPPAPGEPAPETADERQAAIVAKGRK